MEQGTSKIIFYKDRFKNSDELYKKIGEQLQLLIETGHVFVAYDLEEMKPELKAIVIEFSQNSSLDAFPYFLYPDEAQFASFYITKKSLEQFNIDDENITEVFLGLDKEFRDLVLKKKKEGDLN